MADTSPGEVTLQGARAVLDNQGIVRFEIDYRFTSGKPMKHYLCEINFLGVEQRGVKPIDPGEMTEEGTITTGFDVGDKPVKQFDITLSEADSPQQGYQLISNTLTGTVERADNEP